MKKVTDPAILAQLNGGQPTGPKKVTDPAVLAQLNGTAAPAVSPQQAAADYFAKNGVPGYGPVAGMASAVEAVPLAGPTLRKGLDFLAGVPAMVKGTPMDQAMSQAGQNIDAARKGAPIESATGTVAGTLAPFGIGGSIPGVARVLGMEGGLVSQIGFGAGSGAVINGADTLARGGTVDDALRQGAIGAGAGAVLPAVAAGVGKVVGAGSSKALPAVSDLEDAKRAAYQVVDNSGVKYSAQAFDNLITDMFQRASKMSPTRHKLAFDMLSDIQSRKGPITLTQLDELRQEIYRDVAGLTSPEARGDAHFGQQMIDALDDFIENAKPSDMVGGNATAAHQAITTARAANTTFRKAQALQNIIEETKRRVAATGSGGNVDNALRQSMNALLKDKKLHWTAEERKAIGNVVLGAGGNLQGVLRVLGKLSPSGNGLMAMLGLLGTAANPANALIPAAGIVAKTISDTTTKSGLGKLESLVRTGTAVPPRISPRGLSLPPGGAYPMLTTRPLAPIHITVAGGR